MNAHACPLPIEADEVLDGILNVDPDEISAPAVKAVRLVTEVEPSATFSFTEGCLLAVGALRAGRAPNYVSFVSERDEALGEKLEVVVRRADGMTPEALRRREALRVNELLESNNAYQAEARDARMSARVAATVATASGRTLTDIGSILATISDATDEAEVRRAVEAIRALVA